MTAPSSALGFARTPEQPVWILHVTGAAGDHASLRGILKQPKWQVHHVRNCWEARNVLHTCRVSVVLSDAKLADGDWKSLLQATSRLPGTPALVVYSHRADDRLWSEVLNLGGYDMLVTPFEAAEVERVLESAHLASGLRKEPSAAPRVAGAARAAYGGFTP